jgi:hypothetical protein
MLPTHRYYDKPWERTNNGKVVYDISIRYQYGSGEDNSDIGITQFTNEIISEDCISKYSIEI